MKHILLALLILFPPHSFGNMVLYKLGKFQSSASNVSQELLDEIIQKAKSGHRILLEGRTDPRGTDKSNLDLSRFRAVYLRNYLVEKLNIHPNRFIVNYYGEIDPISIQDRDNRSVAISYIKDENEPMPPTIAAREEVVQKIKEPEIVITEEKIDPAPKKLKRIPSRFAPVVVALSAYEADMDGKFKNDVNRRVDEVLSEVRFELSIESAYKISKKLSIPFEIGLRMNEYSEDLPLRISNFKKYSPYLKLGVRHQTTSRWSNTVFLGWDNQLIHLIGSTNEIIPDTEQIAHIDYEPQYIFFKKNNWGLYLKPLVSYLVGLEDIDDGITLGSTIGLYYKKMDFFVRYRQSQMDHNETREITTEDLTIGAKYKF